MTMGVVAAVAAASAQTPAGAAPAPGQAPAAPAQAPASPATTPDPPAGYSYDPAGRRDPFVSLVRRGNDNVTNETGVRPAGVGGIAVSELTIKGTMQSRNGYVALVQGPDLKTYIVKPGDKLYDGTIRAITANAMVLMQQINDPLSLDKQREVRKVLRQADEVK
jgi:Tfp pilus assembly protein PilP